MAIIIKAANGGGIVYVPGTAPTKQEVDILTDTEAEILAFGETVTDMYGAVVEPTPGSMAHTAGHKADYELSPSGVWTKMG